jgi:hypothetical protein
MDMVEESRTADRGGSQTADATPQSSDLAGVETEIASELVDMGASPDEAEVVASEIVASDLESGEAESDMIDALETDADLIGPR